MLKFGMFLFKVFIKLCNPMNYTGPPPPPLVALRLRTWTTKNFRQKLEFFFCLSFLKVRLLYLLIDSVIFLVMLDNFLKVAKKNTHYPLCYLDSRSWS